MMDSILGRIQRYDEEQAWLRQFVIPGSALVHIDALAWRVSLVSS
jgi:hypothetical protein